jgi:hypothetical protein
MSKATVSFKVPPKLWENFQQQSDDLFLSRAPFLNYMLRRELQSLEEELHGLRQSLRAKRHISGKLKMTGPTPVSIEVDAEVAATLRRVVKQHNIVRDAFICRLLVFLRSTDTLLDWLEVPKAALGGRRAGGLEDMPTSPLRAMEVVRDDPLYYVRNHVEDVQGCGIYRVALPPGAEWAACYLPDDEVPTTGAFKRRQKDLNLMLSLLEPETAPKRASRKQRGVKK